MGGLRRFGLKGKGQPKRNILLTDRQSGGRVYSCPSFRQPFDQSLISWFMTDDNGVHPPNVRATFHCTGLGCSH